MRAFKFNISLIFVAFILFCSCHNTGKKIKVAANEILHDNSSKVWILKNQYEGDVDRTPYNRLDKWVLTFYSDNTFVLTTLGHFSDYSLHQGDFEFTDNNQHLIYKWKSGQVDKNKIELIDRTNLVYILEKVEQPAIKMHFIPIDKMPVPPSIDLEEF